MTTGTQTQPPETEEKKQQALPLERQPMPGHKDEKLLDTLKNISKEDVVDYARNNTIDTIAYGVLILGIIMLLFTPYLGQVLVGAVAAYYFSVETYSFIKNVRTNVDHQPIVRSLIFAGALLALFIASPLLFVTAVVIAALKQLILSQNKGQQP